MELFDKELQAAHFQLLSESTNSQLAMVSIQNIAKYVHLLFALATNCSQLSLLISWLVKYDSRYSVLRFCDSFYAEQPLSVFDSSIRPPTEHCPLCLAQRHSCELCSASHRGQCVFWGKYGWQSTVSPQSLAVCHTHQPPQNHRHNQRISHYCACSQIQ